MSVPRTAHLSHAHRPALGLSTASNHRRANGRLRPPPVDVPQLRAISTLARAWLDLDEEVECSVSRPAPEPGVERNAASDRAAPSDAKSARFEAQQTIAIDSRELRAAMVENSTVVLRREDLETLADLDVASLARALRSQQLEAMPPLPGEHDPVFDTAGQRVVRRLAVVLRPLTLLGRAVHAAGRAVGSLLQRRRSSRSRRALAAGDRSEVRRLLGEIGAALDRGALEQLEPIVEHGRIVGIRAR